MHRSTPPPHNASFSEDSSSYSIVNWLSAHKNILLWVFFALIIFLIIFSRFLNWKTLNAEQDFFQAQAIFTQFQQATDLSNKDSTSKNDFGQLEALMQRHPELKPKYEGAIAQTLLIEQQPDRAEKMIEDIFNRAKFDYLRSYQDYTRASLLITKGLYIEALQYAQQLRAHLDQIHPQNNPILYAFNLIRLALLHQKLKSPQEELKVWEEFQIRTKISDTALVVSQMLNTNQALLNQYIEERKTALTP